MSENNTASMDIKVINEGLMDCPDIIRKKIYIDNKYEGLFIYLNEVIDHNLIYMNFIKPLSQMSLEQLSNKYNVYNNCPTQIEILKDSASVIQSIMHGRVVLVSEKLPFAIAGLEISVNRRNIEEPVTEKNIRGAHDGFVEAINTNLSVIRTRIKNNKLKFKTAVLGTQTSQTIAVVYIEGIANPQIVNKLYDKLKQLNLDGLSNIGQIEQLICSHPNSIFPQFLSTERPDKVAEGLLEGRIAIIQDGTPRVLIAPINFLAFFQATDDYSNLWIQGSFLRFLRIVALLIAIFLPSMYIAIISFHYYAIPLTLLIPLAESRAKVPFPPIVEAFILEFTVEMVREAAIRLPTYIGTAISVVAGLIIGQAAVEAGIVSNLLIIIVAATAIASYVIPSQDMALAVRIIRFTYMLFAAIFGIIGIVVVAALTAAHLIRLESLGQPYCQPISPLSLSGLKDSFIRMPYNLLKERPYMTRTKNKTRGGKDEG